MAAKLQLYDQLLELLTLYNTSVTFKRSFLRLLKNPGARYKGWPLKKYIQVIAELDYQYRHYLQSPFDEEHIDELFEKFYRNQVSFKKLEDTVARGESLLPEEEEKEIKEIEEMPENEQKQEKKKEQADRSVAEVPGEIKKPTTPEETVDYLKQVAPKPISKPITPSETAAYLGFLKPTPTERPNILRRVANVIQGKKEPPTKLTVAEATKRLESISKPTEAKSILPETEVKEKKESEQPPQIPRKVIERAMREEVGEQPIFRRPQFKTPEFVKNAASQGQIKARDLGGRTANSLGNMAKQAGSDLLNNGANLGGKAGNAALKLAGNAARQLLAGLGRAALMNPWTWVIIGVLLLLLLLPLFFDLLKSNTLLPPAGVSFGGTVPGPGGGTPGSSQIQITKTGPSAVDNKENITYTIKVTFIGSGKADLEITDLIPDQTAFVDAPENGDVPAGVLTGKAVKWVLPTLSANQTKEFTLVVKPLEDDIWVVNSGATATITKAYPIITGGGCPTQAQIDANKANPLSCQYFNPPVDIFNTNFTEPQIEAYFNAYKDIAQSKSGRNAVDFEEKIRHIIERSQKAGLNPVIALGYWRTESYFGNGFGCPNSPPDFDSQLNCVLGGNPDLPINPNSIEDGSVGPRCAREGKLGHSDWKACQYAASFALSHAALDPSISVSIPITTLDDLAEMHGSRAPNLEVSECEKRGGTHEECKDKVNNNCTHTYNWLMEVVITTNSCQASAGTTPLAQCKFTKGDQTPPAVPYQSSKLISYFQEAADKTSVPAAILAGITRVESTTIDASHQPEDQYTISDYTNDDITYMENYDASNIPDVVLTESNAATEIDKIKDVKIGSTTKAVCPVSSNRALGLMQIQPVGTNGIRDDSNVPTLDQAAREIGKTSGKDLTLRDYCDPKKALLLGGGFVLGKLNKTSWTASMSNLSTITTLIQGYYGCVKYPSCANGPGNYAEDLWNSLNECKE